MRVGVVGAGISGLAVIHALADSECDVVAYEARNEAGGIVRSRAIDGRVVDLGPQRLRLTPAIESLVATLDLEGQLRIGDDDQPLYIYYDGQLRVAPLSVRDALTTDLLSPLGKLRILAEPLTAPAREGETVDSVLCRRFGRQAARRYMGPLYSGLYGTDPREMLYAYSLGRALENAGVGRSLLWWLLRRLAAGRETPPICTFDDGLGTLTTALYEAHADTISLETPVTEIRSVADGYELLTPEGRDRVDHVVLTTPAPTSAELLAGVDESLSETLAEFVYNPITMVFLDSALDREGIGALVPPDGELPISGTTWNASFLDRERLFTCYVDPNSYPEMAEQSDSEIGSVAADAFEQLTGVSATPIHVHRWEPGMPAYDRSWKAMESLSPPPDIHFCANFVGRPGMLGRIRNGKQLASELASL